MKILFLSALYPPQTRGGGELSTHYIAQGLRQIGHEVQVVTTGARNGAYEVEGVPVRVLAANLTAKPLLERRHSRKMAKILAREINSGKKYDVVHAHDFRSALALAELNLPNALVTTRDYAQICGSPNNLLADGRECPGCTSIKNVLQNRNVVEAPFLRKPFRVWQYRYNIGYRLKAFRKFKQQVFISHAQLAEIKKIQDLSQTQTTVIYNPVPPAYLNNAIQLPVGRTILFVGTIESYKGVGLLLEAFKQISRQYNDINLKIVGEGAGKEGYQNWVEKNGLQYRVTFVGRVPWDHMGRIYDEAAIVVAPHIWVEPFGRTVAEAMARGKIVISANIGGPAEIIQPFKTGVLFERGSVEDLILSIGEVLEMNEFDKREISRAAREWVANNLNIEKIAREYEEVYKNYLC